MKKLFAAFIAFAILSIVLFTYVPPRFSAGAEKFPESVITYLS